MKCETGDTGILESSKLLHRQEQPIGVDYRLMSVLRNHFDNFLDLRMRKRITTGNRYAVSLTEAIEDVKLVAYLFESLVRVWLVFSVTSITIEVTGARGLEPAYGIVR